MPAVPREAFLEFFLNGWTPVTALQRSPITISRGRLDWAGDVSPSRFHAELDNASGDLNPDNPKGLYYGLLGQNTPMRYGFVTLRDTYGRTVVDGWGSTTPDGVEGHVTRSLAWTLVGTAADFDVASGVGTVVIASASQTRHAYLAGLIALQDYELTVDVTVPSGTGGDCSGGLIFRGTTTSDFWRLSLTVGDAGAVTMNISDSTGTLRGGVPIVDEVSAGTYRVRALVEKNTIRGKAWPVASVEPYAWQVEYIANPAVTPLNAAGWPGIRARTGSGATNATITYDNYTIRLIRFAGVTGDITPESDSTGNDKWATVEGASVLNRLERNPSPARSAPRTYIPTLSPSHYWPLEEGPLVAESAPLVGTGSMRLISTVATTKHFGAGDLGTWLAKGTALFGGDTLAAKVNIPITSKWAVDHVRAGKVDSDNSLIITQSDNTTWKLQFRPSTNDINVIDPSGAPFPSQLFGIPLYDDATHVIRWQCAQNGPDVDLDVIIDGRLIGFAGFTFTLKNIVKIEFSATGSASVSFAIGHTAVYPNVTAPSASTVKTVMLGRPGETAGTRAQRLCSEEGIPFSYVGDLTTTIPMGPQRAVPLLESLQECAAADSATLVESRMADGLLFVAGASLYNRPAGVTLDYSLGQLTESFKPKRDDRIRNKVTARRVDGGGTYTATQTTGPLNINDPGDDPDGVGVYDASITPDVNVQTDLQLPDIAGWEKHLGTTPTPRFPSITVNCSSQHITTALDDALLTVDVDDRIVVQNLSSLDRYDPVSQLVRGYTETLDTIFINRLEFTCAPESSYHVFEVEHADLGRLDTEGSELAVAVDNDDTAWSVATTSGPLWTTAAADFPLSWKVGGEKIPVTDIDPEVFTFRSVGAAAYADNASVNPALPAGHTSGDLLVLPAAIRSSTGTPSTPTGYEVLADFGNMKFFGKIDNGSESAPTVSFTGGAAGDTTFGQIAAFPGKLYRVSNLVVAKSGILNPSLQNVPYPGLRVPVNNCLNLIFALKQDDWTSIANDVGTEIAESSSTLGDDMGFVWAYVIQTTKANIDPFLFTVTGGASAVSWGGAVALRCDRQAATVTRSANGVVKSHAAGASVQLADPPALALTGA